MTNSTNEMTGEVVLTLGGQELRLKASLQRMAEFQRRLDVVGVGAATSMIQALDARALLHGAVALSGAESDDAVNDLDFGSHSAEISKALISAIIAGMPDNKKN